MGYLTEIYHEYRRQRKSVRASARTASQAPRGTEDRYRAEHDLASDFIELNNLANCYISAGGKRDLKGDMACLAVWVEEVLSR